MDLLEYNKLIELTNIHCTIWLLIGYLSKRKFKNSNVVGEADKINVYILSSKDGTFDSCP